MPNLEKMTRQAVELLYEFAGHHDLQVQREFAQYLEEVMAEHYTPKNILITGRTMEAIMENFEEQRGKEV